MYDQLSEQLTSYSERLGEIRAAMRYLMTGPLPTLMQTLKGYKRTKITEDTVRLHVSNVRVKLGAAASDSADAKL